MSRLMASLKEFMRLNGDDTQQYLTGVCSCNYKLFAGRVAFDVVLSWKEKKNFGALPFLFIIFYIS